MRICCLFIYFLKKCQMFCKHILRQSLSCEIIATEVDNMLKKNEKMGNSKNQTGNDFHIFLNNFFSTVKHYVITNKLKILND